MAVKEKVFATESEKTKKARDKLLKIFREQEKQITPEALQLKKNEMNLWLAKYASTRISVPDTMAKPSASLIKRVTGVKQQSEKEKQVFEKVFKSFPVSHTAVK